MLNDFKKFIMHGSVMDLVVAVIIGTAFGKIIASLVSDIVMPLIGLALGGVDFGNLAITVGNAKIGYGSFIQAIVDFLIIAMVIFMMVRAVNSMKKPAALTTKECPRCFTAIPIMAMRCPNCTSEL